jgi:hypothetical protein
MSDKATVETLERCVANLEERIRAIVWQLNNSAKTHGLIVTIGDDGIFSLQPTPAVKLSELIHER